MRNAIMIRRFALVLAGYACLIAAKDSASQGYPNKSVRLVVPNAAGGPSDRVARQVAQQLAERVGQQVIVDNRPGAAGIIGTEFVAKEPPDGYTLMWVSINHTINPSVYRKLPYDPVKDFAPITLATSGPLLLALHPSVPANDLKGLLRLDRARPGELTGASAGSGSIAHLTLELLNHMAGSKIVHIPYKGAGQALSDLLGGHVSMYFGNIIGLLPHVKTGKLKGLAVSTRSRSAAAPDILTVAESGVPAYEASSWMGVMARAGTPKEIISRLNADIVGELKKPETQAKLAASGLQIIASTPEQFGSHVESEIAQWGKLVKAAGVAKTY